MQILIRKELEIENSEYENLKFSVQFKKPFKWTDKGFGI